MPLKHGGHQPGSYRPLLDAPPPPPPLPPPPPPKPDGDSGDASPAIVSWAKNTYGSAGEREDGAGAAAAAPVVPPPHRDNIPHDRQGPNRWCRGSTGCCRRARQLTRSRVAATLGDSDGASGCAADGVGGCADRVGGLDDVAATAAAVASAAEPLPPSLSPNVVTTGLRVS